MATPNKIEVFLSFKSDFAALNLAFSSVQKHLSAFQTRLQQVQAFNQRITNGEAALQRALGQLGAVLGGAALVKYARDAREADKVQAQLMQTLRQTGQTGALQALNAQASSLQKLTLFSDEAVNTVQRLLISFGVSAQQAEGLTENVLDFAQATNQSAEAAALLIGRTLAGESDELGRYKIQLDTTKGKVEALGDALRRTFERQARAAVPDRAQRDVDARFADATENIGRAANTAAVPFFQALLPLLERFAAWATANAGNIARTARNLGELAAQAAPLVLAFGAFRGAMTAVALLLNPLRTAVVLFSGRSLQELSAALAKTTGGAQGLWTTLRGGSGVLTGLGSALSAVGAVAAAFGAGLQLGGIINDLEVSGLKVRVWAALWVEALRDTIGAAFSGLRLAWTNTSFALREGLNLLLLFIREKQLAAQEALNGVLESFNRVAARLGINQAALFDTQGLRDEVDALNSKIGELEAARLAAVAAIKAERAAQAADSAGNRAFIAEGDDAFRSGRPARARAVGAADRADLNAGQFGATDASRKAEQDLAAKREAFALDTRILQARVAGDQALVDQLTRQRDRQQALNDLGANAALLIEARLDLEQQLADQGLARQTQEQNFSRSLGDLGIQRAEIESDRLLTAEEKQKKLLPLLEKENALIAARLALLLQEQQIASPADRLQLQQQIDQLRTDQATNAGAREDNRQLGIGEQVNADLTEFETSIGTRAQALANLFTSPIKAGIGALRNGMQALLGDTDFWSQKLGRIAGPIMGALTGAVSDLFQQWIANQILTATVGKAVLAASVAATAPLAALQAQIWAVPATLSVIATAGGTAAAAPLEIALATAGVKAQALAGFSEGGLVNGPGSGTSDSIPARLSNGEFVATASAVDRFGPDFFSGLNAGVLDLAALPGSVAAQLPRAVSAARSSSPAPRSSSPAPDMQALAERITIIQVSSRAEATRIARHSAARGDIVRIVEEDFGLPRKT